MSEQIGNLSREMETIKKKKKEPRESLELKVIIAEVKN